MDIKHIIIAIDGPSASGKSTLGKTLAKRYGLTYIDTGAMYRAVAWLAKQIGIDWSDEGALVSIIETKPIDISTDEDGLIRVSIDGKEVTHEIRTPDIGSGASRISALPGVKRALIKKQQEMGASGGVVMDGRDIGTFVFPNADFKFYLDASMETRSMRRFEELKAKGIDVDITEISASMRQRDHNDSSRAVAPLRKAPDADFIDTTKLSLSEVLEAMIDHIENTPRG